MPGNCLWIRSALAGGSCARIAASLVFLRRGFREFCGCGFCSVDGVGKERLGGLSLHAGLSLKMRRLDSLFMPECLICFGGGEHFIFYHYVNPAYCGQWVYGDAGLCLSVAVLCAPKIRIYSLHDECEYYVFLLGILRNDRVKIVEESKQ